MENFKILTAISLLTFSLMNVARTEIQVSQPNLKEKSITDDFFTLKEFFTDGCTLFVNGPKNHPNLWKHCCIEHDLRYWPGGSIDDRDVTDLRLKACIKEVAGENWANIIYYGVKAGHISPIKNKTYWSWGWKEARAPGPLSTDEINIVKKEIGHMKIPEIDLQNFLKVNFP